MKGWAITMAVMAVVSILSLPAVSAEEPGFDQDLGEKYSMKIQFIFTGDAETVHWEFGDGKSSDYMDPIHEYDKEGVYYVTQTAINGSGDDIRKSVAVYKVTIKGYPEIVFDSMGGSPVETIKQTGFNKTAVEPEDPKNGDLEFTGWFTDKELTEPMDWNSGIRMDMTLYAGWSGNINLTIDTGTSTIERKIPYGSIPEMPTLPHREGYEFAGWFIGDEAFDQSTPLTADAVITAAWDRISEPVIPSEDDPPSENRRGSIGTSAIAGILAFTLAVSLSAVFITRRH